MESRASNNSSSSSSSYRTSSTLNHTVQSLMKESSLPSQHDSTSSNDGDMSSSGIGSLNDSDTEVEDEDDRTIDFAAVEEDYSSMGSLQEQECTSTSYNNKESKEDTSSSSSSSTSSNSSVVTSNSSATTVKGKIRHFSFGALYVLEKQQSKRGESGGNDPKKVRFADSLGLDLVQVNLYEKNFSDSEGKAAAAPQQITLVKMLLPMFMQPASLPNFLELVRENRVCLENAFLDADHLSVKGIVRVLNMDYHKAVYIRWTQDEWKSMCDYRASYVDGSNDVMSDKFQFKIYAPLNKGQSLVFAVRYHCAGEQFWDNNFGSNYRFVCMAVERNQEEGQQEQQQQVEKYLQ